MSTPGRAVEKDNTFGTAITIFILLACLLTDNFACLESEAVISLSGVLSYTDK
jgi:hypothetical protein